MPERIYVKEGEVFGYWTATGESEKRYSGKRPILFDKCICVCGKEKRVRHDHLLHGRTTNCGCIKDKKSGERLGKAMFKHGMEGSHPYRKFEAAKARCENKNNKSYQSYGARGIKVERKDFSEFWKDMKDSYYEHVKQYGEENTTMDRIDVDGNYCKENCRWATRYEQNNNKTTNRKVIYRGNEYSSVRVLCDKTGTKYGLVRDRIIKQGWSVEDAIERPLVYTK